MRTPPHSLIGLYLVARIPERGILVKQPIEVRPDPEHRPARLGRRPTSPSCPSAPSTSTSAKAAARPLDHPAGLRELSAPSPASPPGRPPTPTTPPPPKWSSAPPTFTIERGVDGGACPSGPAPFDPGFEAGTLNNQAGSYSPFLMHLTRRDGEQDMGRFSFMLPPGVVPKLAGIPYCPEAAIAQAQSRQGPHGGAEEKDEPLLPGGLPDRPHRGRRRRRQPAHLRPRASSTSPAPTTATRSRPSRSPRRSPAPSTPARSSSARRCASTRSPTSAKSTAPPRTRSPTSSRASR